MWSTMQHLLVISHVQVGGEWIATYRLLNDLRQFQLVGKLSLLGLLNQSSLFGENLRLFDQVEPYKLNQATKPFRYWKNLFYDVYRLRKLIGKYKNEDQHVDYVLTTDYRAALALVGLPFKLIYSFHGVKAPLKLSGKDFNLRNLTQRILEQIVFLRAEKIITPSETGNQKIKNLLGYFYRSNKVIICPQIIPKEYFIQNPVKQIKKFCSRYNLTAKKKVLYCGRIARFKGLENLIKGFQLYFAHDHQAQLILAYPQDNVDAEVMKCLQKIVATNNDAQIKSLPDLTTKDLIKLYQSANLIVLPSETEIDPLVLYEAIACKTIPLTTNTCHFTEKLRKILPDLILENNSPEEICAKIKLLLSIKKNKITENLRLLQLDTPENQRRHIYKKLFSF